MIRCSTCRNEHFRTGQRQCRRCHAAYMRRWRKAHPFHGAPRETPLARLAAKYAKPQVEAAV